MADIKIDEEMLFCEGEKLDDRWRHCDDKRGIPSEGGD